MRIYQYLYECPRSRRRDPVHSSAFAWHRDKSTIRTIISAGVLPVAHKRPPDAFTVESRRWIRNQTPRPVSQKPRDKGGAPSGLVFDRISFPMVLFERVHDFHAVNRSGVLHVFGEDYAAPGLFGGPKDQSVPEGKAMEAVEVDCGENVGDLGCSDVELGEQFHLAACDARVNAQFLRDRDEILLKDLHRHNAGPGAPVLGYEIDGPALFCRRRLVVCIDEDVGVEEATNAHESRPD